MSQTVEQFIGNLPSSGAILHKLDENAAERQMLRDMLKLAKNAPATESGERREAAHV